jgi:sulfate adenylyltransferase subunit 1 (EFTu-like GTPase family)
VQTVIRPQDVAAPDFRGLAGQVASGVFRPGDEILHLPTGFTAFIRAIRGSAGNIESAFHPMSVVMELDRDLDIGRGDMLVRPNNKPSVTQELEVMLCWLSEKPLDTSRRYSLRHTTAETKCLVREVRYKLDVRTLHRQSTATTVQVQMNDFARVSLRIMAPIFCDSYKKNRQTGSLLLVDDASHDTVAAGLVI